MPTTDHVRVFKELEFPHAIVTCQSWTMIKRLKVGMSAPLGYRAWTRKWGQGQLTLALDSDPRDYRDKMKKGPFFRR